MILYTDENDNPQYIIFCLPSDWSMARDYVRTIGYQLGSEILYDNPENNQFVLNLCRSNRNFRHLPRYPWVYYMYELVPIDGFQLSLF